MTTPERDISIPAIITFDWYDFYRDMKTLGYNDHIFQTKIQ